MKSSNKPERRTFLEDRFEILIKKQKNGQATFNELTELDEIVNRNATIREMVLEEMQTFNGPADDNLPAKDILPEVKKQPANLLSLVKNFVGRLFTLKVSFSIPSLI